AREAGLVPDKEPLLQGAELVASMQDKDGSWFSEAQGTLGSPATYGTSLATVVACRTLAQVDARRYEARIARAETWLRQKKVLTVLDAAAVLLGLGRADDPPARKQRSVCLEVIRKGEGKEGGWGPYVTSASEAFDTALVVLAMRVQPETA